MSGEWHVFDIVTLCVAYQRGAMHEKTDEFMVSSHCAISSLLDLWMKVCLTSLQVLSELVAIVVIQNGGTRHSFQNSS